jgi:putative effector of murein hydrolase
LLLTDDKILLLSLLPKSVTSPIAMAVANQIGGLAPLAAAVVIAVGLVGALGGFSLLKLFKITDPQAQGLAMGCSAHAIGTAKAMEVGNEQGAFSSLALVLSGILTAVLAPFFAWFIGIIITI